MTARPDPEEIARGLKPHVAWWLTKCARDDGPTSGAKYKPSLALETTGLAVLEDYGVASVRIHLTDLGRAVAAILAVQPAGGSDAE